MIIAIDESGAFDPRSSRLDCFAAVHVRQRKTLLRTKSRQHASWENALPRRLRSANGEVKGSALSDSHLRDFAQSVVASHPCVRVTPIAIRPSDNALAVIGKHQEAHAGDIARGSAVFTELGRHPQAATYAEFSRWLLNRSPTEYLKIQLLGACIGEALASAFGTSVAGRYPDELLHLRYVIDRDFVRGRRSDLFWHEFLRNQLHAQSVTRPVPIPERWRTRPHPVLAEYAFDGQLDMNKVFWSRLAFSPSHESFELRIADVVATIVRRHLNSTGGAEAFAAIRPFLAPRELIVLALEDFDPARRSAGPMVNPWLRMSRSQART